MVSEKMNSDFYRKFEDVYRGDREVIKKRLSPYAAYAAESLESGYGDGFLDLGCGRAEWVELLTGLGFSGIGVDSDVSMITLPAHLKLNVKHIDLFDYLKTISDDSLSVVSAFHVIEHVDFDDLIRLTREVHRVLAPGGTLIFETPNPENISVGSSSFYLDPSHDRPIPPPLLEFLIGYCGFDESIVLRLQGLEVPTSLYGVLVGSSRDYGVVARKSGGDLLPLIVRDGLEGSSSAALSAVYDAEMEQRLSSVEKNANDTLVSIEARMDELSSSLETQDRTIKQAIAVANDARSLNTELGSILKYNESLLMEKVEFKSQLASARQRQKESRITVSNLKEHIANQERMLAVSKMHYDSIFNSKLWRATKIIRYPLDLIKRGIGRSKVFLARVYSFLKKKGVGAGVNKLAGRQLLSARSASLSSALSENENQIYDQLRQK